MATECFVRQLREEVENNSLPRINTLCINISAEGNYNFRFDGITNFEIDGDGYFTNSGYSDNLGKELVRSIADNTNIVYIKATGSLTLYVFDMSNATGSFITYIANSGNSISFNIAEVLQNEVQYDTIQVGAAGDTIINRGNSCIGDITNLEFNTKNLAMSGCARITGDASNVIAQASKYNLNSISFSQTNIVYSTEALIGKKYLYITPNKPVGNTDIKYLGDTRNRFVYANAANSSLYTGTIESLVDRLIANGRTSADDYFYTIAGVRNNGGATGRYKNVTYQNKSIADYYIEYDAIHPNAGTYYVIFRWDAQANITMEITSTPPASKYVPLDEID